MIAIHLKLSILAGTIFDAQVVPTCGSKCVLTLTRDTAEVEFLANHFVR